MNNFNAFLRLSKLAKIIVPRSFVSRLDNSLICLAKTFNKDIIKFADYDITSNGYSTLNNTTTVITIFIGHCGVFCRLKWRIQRAKKKYLSTLS